MMASSAPEPPAVDDQTKVQLSKEEKAAKKERDKAEKLASKAKELENKAAAKAREAEEKAAKAKTAREQAQKDKAEREAVKAADKARKDAERLAQKEAKESQKASKQATQDTSNDARKPTDPPNKVRAAAPEPPPEKQRKSSKTAEGSAHEEPRENSPTAQVTPAPPIATGEKGDAMPQSGTPNEVVANADTVNSNVAVPHAPQAAAADDNVKREGTPPKQKRPNEKEQPKDRAKPPALKPNNPAGNESASRAARTEGENGPKRKDVAPKQKRAQEKRQSKDSPANLLQPPTLIQPNSAGNESAPHGVHAGGENDAKRKDTQPKQKGPNEKRQSKDPPPNLPKPLASKQTDTAGKVTVGTIGRPLAQGWLTKQGHVVKNWKRRWFMLKGQSLFYFASDDDNEEPKGRIELVGYVITRCTADDEPELFKKLGKREGEEINAFKIVHEEKSNKDLYLLAPTTVSMEAWIHALLRAQGNGGETKQRPADQPDGKINVSETKDRTVEAVSLAATTATREATTDATRTPFSDFDQTMDISPMDVAQHARAAGPKVDKGVSEPMPVVDTSLWKAALEKKKASMTSVLPTGAEECNPSKVEEADEFAPLSNVASVDEQSSLDTSAALLSEYSMYYSATIPAESDTTAPAISIPTKDELDEMKRKEEIARDAKHREEEEKRQKAQEMVIARMNAEREQAATRLRIQQEYAAKRKNADEELIALRTREESQRRAAEELAQEQARRSAAAEVEIERRAAVAAAIERQNRETELAKLREVEAREAADKLDTETKSREEAEEAEGGSLERMTSDEMRAREPEENASRGTPPVGDAYPSSGMAQANSGLHATGESHQEGQFNTGADDDGDDENTETTAAETGEKKKKKKKNKKKKSCGKCAEVLSGKVVQVGEAYFHLECFECTKCGKKLTSSCINVGNKPYCEACSATL